MNTSLYVENLGKRYRGDDQFSEKWSLQNIDFHLPEGKITGLLGPNGAGKTTFIRLLMQILRPDQGRLYCQGQILNRDHLKVMGYLPEERGLYKKMSVKNQIIYLGQLRGLSLAKTLEQMTFWFDRLEISTEKSASWYDKTIDQISKGMAQKIQFIVAILHDPIYIILDEPLSGLDPLNAQLIQQQILYLKKQGKTILMSSHQMDALEKYCDYFIFLHNGKKILEGDLQLIKNKMQISENMNTISVSLSEIFIHFTKN